MTAAALVVASVVVAAPPALPTPPGFEVTSGPTRYGPDNLYEYINGGADAFLQQDFEELSTATYADARKVEVTVDVYRHRDPARAYAMYTQERPSSATPVPVGIEGYAGDDHFELVVGSYYVKLTQAGPRAKLVLREIAERVAAALPGTREKPAVLAAFPAAGRVARSERLSGHDFLGHAFLHDGVTMQYDVGGVSLRLFVVEGRDAADAREMLARYLALAKAPPTDQSEGDAALKDPLNGEVRLRWRDRWLWGAVDAPAKAPGALLDELGRKLPGGGTGAQVLRTFYSDGCSLFVDGTPSDPRRWCACCFVHDLAYWAGGTEAQRLAADEALRDCVRAKTDDPRLATAMFQAVRLGGAPVFPNWYRWGYGWPYGRGYEPLTEAELAQVTARRAEYERATPGGYCARKR